MRRLRTQLALVLCVLLSTALPAGGKNRVTVRGDTVRIQIPLSADIVEALETAGGRLLQRGRTAGVHGCLDVDLRPITAEQPHRIITVPQRPGQFVRGVVSADDPYRQTRTIVLGSGALDRRPEDLLISLTERSPDPPDVAPADLFRRLVTSLSSHPRVERLGCEITFEADVETVDDGLTVESDLRFRVTIEPDGTISGRVPPHPRRASAPGTAIGSCSGSAGTTVPMDIRGASEGPKMFLRFTTRGHEPDFTIGCTNGTLEASGDYIWGLLHRVGQVGIKLERGVTRTLRGAGEFQGTVDLTIRSARLSR